ncbi:MAG: ABC transporter permease, partial [Deltaproteobacteria bacterium]|nr:ABC transporter permease [Deltaproteobacteria bacterium]
PNFLLYDNIINIFYHSAILSMLVLGQGLILLTGNLDLSIESTLAFAPAVAMLTATKWLPGLDPYTTIILTLAVGALIGLFNGFVVSKVGIHSFIHSLSMLIILRGLTLFMVPFAIYKLDPVYTFFGSERLAGNIPIAALLMVAIFLVMNFVLKNTPFGRFILATGGNPRASFISGINTSRMIVYAFVLSGLLAAVAGLLAAGRQDAINNTMGKDMVLLSFAGAILGGASLSGGRGTPLGMLGGALLLGMIDNSLTLIGVNVFILYACYGLLIFLAVILDRFKSKWREHLFHKESLKKLHALSQTSPPNQEGGAETCPS